MTHPTSMYENSQWNLIAYCNNRSNNSYILFLINDSRHWLTHYVCGTRIASSTTMADELHDIHVEYTAQRTEVEHLCTSMDSKTSIVERKMLIEHVDEDVGNVFEYHVRMKTKYSVHNKRNVSCQTWWWILLYLKNRMKHMLLYWQEKKKQKDYEILNVLSNLMTYFSR